MELSEDYRCFTKDTTLTGPCALANKTGSSKRQRSANRLNQPESEDKQLKQRKRGFVKTLRTTKMIEFCYLTRTRTV